MIDDVIESTPKGGGLVILNGAHDLELVILVGIEKLVADAGRGLDGETLAYDVRKRLIVGTLLATFCDDLGLRTSREDKILLVAENLGLCRGERGNGGRVLCLSGNRSGNGKRKCDATGGKCHLNLL